MKLTNKMAGWGRQLSLAGIGLLAVALPSCTFTLDFDECTIDEDCAGDAVCGEDRICEAPPGKARVTVDSNVIEDTTWTADKEYVLTTLVTVLPSVTLTIEPGTTILGERGSALVVRDGGAMEASGTREAPIVFTSSKPEGQRQTGDWGGIAMLGKAPVNRENATLNIITDEAEARFGGNDETWRCGSLEYVRVEFGGGQVAGEEALNGVTLAGCGSDTVVDRLHVHFGADDGLELFGGTVNLRYVLVTRAQDDGIDIDLGWRGEAQYVAVQQDAAGDNAIEIDNLGEDPLATPLTDFRISNYTIIGPGDMGLTRGITFKAGAGGFFTHGVVMGATLEAIDVFGAEAGQRGLDGEIVVRDTLFFDIGPNGEEYFPIAGEEGETGDDGTGDDDGGFAEPMVFANEALNNTFGVDPAITRAYDLVEPGWVPTNDAAVIDVERPPDGFDPTAVFRGAFTPGADPWTEDWTAFPGG